MEGYSFRECQRSDGLRWIAAVATTSLIADATRHECSKRHYAAFRIEIRFVEPPLRNGDTQPTLQSEELETRPPIGIQRRFATAWFARALSRSIAISALVMRSYGAVTGPCISGIRNSRRLA